MNSIKRIGILLLVVAVTTGIIRAEKPDATLELSGGSIAAGIGFSWGSGTLNYKGKSYPVSVNGLSLGKVGITGGSASGKVYHLRNLQDFNGHYNAGGAGMTVAGGRNVYAMTNQNGVKILITSTTTGVDLTLAGGGVDLQLK
jgi:hypothetical protein